MTPKLGRNGWALYTNEKKWIHEFMNFIDHEKFESLSSRFQDGTLSKSKEWDNIKINEVKWARKKKKN